MSELDEIKARKLAELQAAQNAHMQREAQEQTELHKKIAQLENIVKQVFTKEALQRYGNIKAVDPEKAVKIIAVIGQLVQSGRIGMVDDEILKKILATITPEKKEFKIRRV